MAQVFPSTLATFGDHHPILSFASFQFTCSRGSTIAHHIWATYHGVDEVTESFAAYAVFLGLLLGTTDVAIKVVERPTAKEQQRFEREIELLRACYHPNVIRFLGANIRPEKTFLVMEYCPGDHSTQFLRAAIKIWIHAAQVSARYRGREASEDSSNTHVDSRGH